VYLRLGVDQLAVDENVELAALPGLYLRVIAEPAFERGGQTGRARLIASSGAVKNLSSHGQRVSAREARFKRLAVRTVHPAAGSFAVCSEMD
jgi:hypothetical protein